MLHKEVEIFTYVGKVCPFGNGCGIGVEIVYCCIGHREQNRRMSCDNKLTSRCSCRCRNIFGKLDLISNRKTVFGLVEEIQRILVDTLEEIAHSGFAVRFKVDIARDPFIHIR